MEEIPSEKIPFPFHEFLKRGKDFHRLSFLLILFLLGIFVLYPILQPFLSMLIPVVVAFYIVIISTDYALFRSRFVEIDNTFRAVFDEIIENRKRVENILQNINQLKGAWVQLEKDQWINEKTAIRESYSLDTRFFYQYLPNNAFTVLLARNFDQEIIGARYKADINYYHQIARFYFHCLKTSETTQRIEVEINGLLKQLHAKKEKSSFIPIIDSSSNIVNFYSTEERYDASSFPTTTPICDHTPHEKFYIIKSDELFKAFLTEDGDIDNKKWEEFVETKVEKIIDCFKRFQEEDTEHCPNIKNIATYRDFFSTVIDQNNLFPSFFYSEIVGKWKAEVYLVLLSSVLAIWVTALLMADPFELILTIFSGVISSIIFGILFIIFFIILYILYRIFF